MALFNPISGQYENLCRAMDERKTVGLKEAAEAMNLKPEKVDHSLLIMTKKKMFGPYKPYVDDEMHMVVLDKRYAGYAVVMHAVENLIVRLKEARKMPRSLSERVISASGNGHSGSFGGFFRDLADHYVSGDSGSESFRKAAKNIFRDDKSSSMPRFLDTQDAEETLTELEQYANELRGMLLAYPDKPYAQSLADWLNAVNNTVQTWEGCLEAAVSKKEKGAAMLRAEEKLRRQFLPDFTRKLQELKEPSGSDNIKSPAVKAIEGCVGDLKILRMKLQDLEMQLALDRINDILRQIRSSLDDETLPFNRSALTSLRNCYLPMVKQLAEQYLKYESIRVPGSSTVKAMNETRRVLGKDVPLALQRLLNDIHTGEAINMEAQATALKQKLQMDGLLG